MMEISGLPDRHGFPERIILAADIGLDRASYEALELAMAALLEDHSQTLTLRLLMAHSLVGAAVAEYGRGSKTTSPFAGWMIEMTSAGGRRWLLQEAINWGPGRAERQRLAIATAVAASETRPGDGSGEGGAQNGLRVATAIANARGTLHLPSVSGEVPLERMARVRVDQDAPELSSILTHRLSSWLRGGIILSHPNLLKGTRHLLLCAALVRWYSVATTLAAGHDRVTEMELTQAAEIVERVYVEGNALGRVPDTRRGLAVVVELLLDLLVSPADLAHNPYAGSASL